MDKSPPQTKVLPSPDVPEAEGSMVYIETLHTESIDGNVKVNIPNNEFGEAGDTVTISWTGEGSSDTYTETKTVTFGESLEFMIDPQRYVYPYSGRTVTVSYIWTYTSGDGSSEPSALRTLNVSKDNPLKSDQADMTGE